MYGLFFLKFFVGSYSLPVSWRCLEPGWFVGDPTPLAPNKIQSSHVSGRHLMALIHIHLMIHFLECRQGNQLLQFLLSKGV